MGFFDKIKKAFDAGGIKTELRAPDQFRWQDETLPISIVLTGHETEPRTIASIEIRLREAERDDANSTSRQTEREVIRFEYREAVVLQAGETVTLDIDFPLTATEILDRASATEEVPGWLANAVKVVDTVQSLTLDSSRYVITATPMVEGAKMTRGVSRRITQVGRGDFFAGQGGMTNVD